MTEAVATTGRPRAFFFSRMQRLRAFDVGLLLCVAGVGIVVSHYGFYRWTDPIDNVYGGALITRGILPYTGFFSHHMPFPYFASASIWILSFGSAEAFRLLFTAMLFGIQVLLYRWIGRNISRVAAVSFISLIALSASFTKMHEPLAETFVAYAAAVITCVFMFRVFQDDHRITGREALLVSGLLFVVVMSSLAYVYYAAIIAITFLIFCYSRHRKYPESSTWLRVAAILAAPYFGVIAILVATGALKNFYFGIFTFNQTYYAPYLAYASTIFSWAWQPWASTARIFVDALPHLGNPLFLPYLLSIVVVIHFLWVIIRGKKIGQAIFGILSLVYLMPKPDASLALNTPGTFHAGPFFVFVIALLAITFPLVSLKNHAIRKAFTYTFYLVTVCTAAILVYRLTFLPAFIQKHSERNPEERFAPVINVLLSKDDYFWAGPMLARDVLDVHAKPASTNIFYHPWQASCPQCHQELLVQLNDRLPAVIYFNYRLDVWEYPVSIYAKDVVEFLNAKYYRISTASPTSEFLFFRNDLSREAAERALEYAN